MDYREHVRQLARQSPLLPEHGKDLAQLLTEGSSLVAVLGELERAVEVTRNQLQHVDLSEEGGVKKAIQLQGKALGLTQAIETFLDVAAESRVSEDTDNG